MEMNLNETNIVESASGKQDTTQLVELDKFALSLVGGGSGEVILQ